MYEYVKHIRWAELKVGIILTTAFIIIILTVIFAGDIGELFSKKVPLYAVFDDVKGLRKGAPVWFSGLEIGAVKTLNFIPRHRVRALLLIDADVLKYLKKDSKATILTFGLLGDKYIELNAGSEGAEGLKPGDTITGSSQPEVREVVETGRESIARLSDFIGTLDGIIKRIDKGEGSVARFIKDPSVYQNLKETTEELSRFVKRIEAGEGTMGKLVKEGTLYDELLSSAKDIKLFAESLKTSDGTLNKLINDPSLYDRFLKASENLERFTEKLATSKGTFNRLIEDESLYENINNVSQRLGVLLEKIDNGEGVIGSLVRDDEMSRELKTTIRELNVLIKDMKENPKRYFRFSLF